MLLAVEFTPGVYFKQYIRKGVAHMTYLGQNIKKLGFGLMRLPMM